jgi:hypothetical protein
MTPDTVLMRPGGTVYIECPAGSRFRPACGPGAVALGSGRHLTLERQGADSTRVSPLQPNRNI